MKCAVYNVKDINQTTNERERNQKVAPKERTEYNKTILILNLNLTKGKGRKKTEIFGASGT